MGLFNWVFKGVMVEKRKPKTSSPDAIMDLQQISAEVNKLANSQVNEDGVGHTDKSNGPSAPNSASILFESTERHMNQSYQYDASQFQNAQYSSPGIGTQGQFGASALNGSSYGNRNILVVTPNSNAEVTEVVSNLRNGDACIVCLEGLDVTDAQRRLDFLSGVICAMGGSIKRLNANTYILTPTGIGVRKQSL